MYRHIDYFQTMYKHNQLYIYTHVGERQAGGPPACRFCSLRAEAKGRFCKTSLLEGSLEGPWRYDERNESERK